MVYAFEYVLYMQPLLEMLGDDTHCDWSVFAGLIMQESGGDPKAVGDGGLAYGLAQIHAATKNNHGFSRGWDMERLLDPMANVAILIAEMRRLRGWLVLNYGPEHCGADWLLACWNWGAGNVRRHIEAGLTLDDLPPDVEEHLRLYHEKADLFNKRGDER